MSDENGQPKESWRPDPMWTLHKQRGTNILDHNDLLVLGRWSQAVVQDSSYLRRNGTPGSKDTCNACYE